jgi:hypothetical protein
VFAIAEQKEKNDKTVIENYLKDTEDTKDSSLGKRGFESLRNGEDIIEAIIKAEEFKIKLADYEQDMINYEKSRGSGLKPIKPSLEELGDAKSLPE